MDATITIATLVVALAASVQAGAAILLFRITRQYVQLTQALVENAQAESQRAKESADVAKRVLAVDLRRWTVWAAETVTGPLPRNEPEAAVWIARADAIEAAAQQIGGDVAISAQWAASAIRARADITRVPPAAPPTDDLKRLLTTIDQLFSRLARASIDVGIGVSARAVTSRVDQQGETGASPSESG